MLAAEVDCCAFSAPGACGPSSGAGPVPDLLLGEQVSLAYTGVIMDSLCIGICPAKSTRHVIDTDFANAARPVDCGN